MKNRTGYSIGLLFMFTAFVAVLMASLRVALSATLADQDMGGAALLTTSVTTGLFATFLGAVVGLYHYRPLLGALIGAGAGFVVGCLVGPLLLTKMKDSGTLFAVQLAGAVLLVVISFLLSQSSPKQTTE